MSAHTDKTSHLARILAETSADGRRAVGLAKRTSNLFRDRVARARPRINLANFDEVIRLDPAAGLVDAEGMISYAALVDATLRQGVMPAVVPQLKSITLGGALAGVGIESSSFRHGLVHNAITAIEVLTGDARILTCTPENEHRDLFFGFPNSYGTLGYALSVTTRTVPVKPFVALEHVRYETADACFAAVARHCKDAELDFLDGVVFTPTEFYLTLGRFAENAPYRSDYTYEHIYYRSIRQRATDFLTVRDYLWRWDTDWFWCSKNVGAQNPLVRRLLGRRRLNSVTYQKIMRWNSRWGVNRALSRLAGRQSETVIQDVDIPIDRAAEFLAFLHGEIGILPIWLCPARAPPALEPFTLYPLHPQTIYINFGFWDIVRDRARHPPGYLNRLIERKVTELGGWKSLYSDSYYSAAEFWRIFDHDAYSALKARYDPAGALPDLYEKCVLRH
ncbi:MAG TPA: FAD-binding oxidoreductase [Steroidobacteraceae bacterium]|nr:FAD-binding oxidoreductase [Steroidobacteraceae bacterium]